MSARLGGIEITPDQNNSKMSGQPEMSQNQGLEIFERSGSENYLDEFQNSSGPKNFEESVEATLI